MRHLHTAGAVARKLDASTGGHRDRALDADHEDTAMKQTFLDDLYTDWRRCRLDPTVNRWLQAQSEAEPALEGIRSVAALEAIVQDRSEPLAIVDSVLAALLRRCQNGDEIASRILVGLMLPALTPPAWHPHGSEEFVAQFVAELWHVVSLYPIARRPRAIAANIVRDARQRTHRAFAPAAVEPQAVVRLPAQLPSPERPCPYELAEGRADLRHAVTAANVDVADLALIAVTRIGGQRLTELASGSEVDRLRQRRHRAERRLRSYMAA